MKDRNSSIMLIAVIGIFLVSSFMITATYAYFSLDVTGEDNNNTLTSIDNIEVTYNDTSNVSLVNAYTGEEIIKTFSISNTGSAVAYYDISLINLVNNFGYPDDLVYTLNGTNGGAYVSENTMPIVTNELLASFVRIDVGVTQSYTMKITFKKRDTDQTSNMNKTFSAKINVTNSEDVREGGTVYSAGTLGNAIYSNLTGSSSILDLKLPSSADGVYYTNNSINGTKIYFFRGSNNLRNNVIFGGHCYKIIRTTSDLGIRMIYNGTPVGGMCTQTTEDTTMLPENSAYNANGNFNAYIGYMYGGASSSTYASEHENTYSSTIKTALETWYNGNLGNLTAYLSNSIYCNNRKPVSFSLNSVSYGELGYASNNTGYISAKNISVNKGNASLKCNNLNDRFTANMGGSGNKKLTYPIGLLTADEAVLAGLDVSESNTNNYLYNAHNYWTMTPAYYGSNAYNYNVTSNGKLNSSNVTSSYGIRPVITLKQSTKIKSGTGATGTPYVINE